MLLQSACSGGPEAARRARSAFCTTGSTVLVLVLVLVQYKYY
jgi:hypothetical protein